MKPFCRSDFGSTNGPVSTAAPPASPADAAASFASSASAVRDWAGAVSTVTTKASVNSAATTFTASRGRRGSANSRALNRRPTARKPSRRTGNSTNR